MISGKMKCKFLVNNFGYYEFLKILESLKDCIRVKLLVSEVKLNGNDFTTALSFINMPSPPKCILYNNIYNLYNKCYTNYKSNPIYYKYL